MQSTEMPFSNAARLSDKEIAKRYILISCTYSDISGPLRSLRGNSHIEILEERASYQTYYHTATRTNYRFLSQLDQHPQLFFLVS